MLPAKRVGPTRKTPAILLLLALIFLLTRIAAGLYETKFRSAVMQWVPIARAEQVSKTTGKPILYDFAADWCGPCRLMDEEIYADRNSAQSIDKMFVPVRVIDRQTEEGRNPPEVEALQQRHKIKAFPTMVIVYPDDRKPKVIEGYGGKAEFLKRLQEAAK